MITQDELYNTRRLLKVRDEDVVPEIDRAIEKEFDIAEAVGRRPKIINIERELGLIA